MRWSWCLAAVTAVVFLTWKAVSVDAAKPGVKAGRHLEATRLSERATIITHHKPWAANSLLVDVGQKNLVLVSTPYSTAATDELLAWIRARHPGHTLTAINTHFHLDGAGGNDALRRAGVEVIGSDLTARLVIERGIRRRDFGITLVEDAELREELAATIPVPPSRTFPLHDGLRLKLGNEEVHIIFPGAAHSPDNVVVHFPSQKLLHGGCMVIGGAHAVNRSDAEVTTWSRAIDKVAALGASTIVPGHGTRFDPGLLDNTRRAVESLKPRTVAITVDDLPWVGPPPRAPRTIASALESLAGHIVSRGMPATGFIVGGHAPLDAVKAWQRAGLDVGNHTYSHRGYSKMSVEDFIADVRRNEDVTKSTLGVALQGTFFRYPFLDHGHTDEKIDAMARYMAANHYTYAPVSLDTVDFAFAQVYSTTADRAGVARIYVEHVSESAAHFESLSQKLYGREIPLVLLVHANELNADHLGTVLEMLESRGHRMVTLATALSDDAYQQHGRRPPLVPLRGDRNFLTQVANARGMRVDDVSGQGRYLEHWKPKLDALGK